MDAPRFDADLDLEWRAERGRFELVHGEELPMSPIGFEHGDLVLGFGAVLREEARERNAGRFVTEVGFRLGEGALLAPDLALVGTTAMPVADARRRMIRGAPRLAVEIVSPSDEAGALAEKIDLYLAAGVDPVWVLYPTRRLIAVHAPGKPVRLLRGDDVLDGGGAVPGFAMTVEEIFALAD